MATIVKTTKCPSCNSKPLKHYSRNSKWQYHCKSCGIYFTENSYHKRLGRDKDFDLFIKNFLKKNIKGEKLSISRMARENQISRASIYRNLESLKILSTILSWFVQQNCVKDWDVSKASLEISLIGFKIPKIWIENYVDKTHCMVTLKSKFYFNDVFNQCYKYKTSDNFSEISFYILIPLEPEELISKLIPFRKLQQI
ncbi:hypothetical protein ACTJKN_20985 [Pedobacter sp. 22163]|uniref:hypothetical protein n=1 Tax=Pedobacter sp. 22163 TaxID=3453883 RepID=UPI003F8401DE